MMTASIVPFRYYVSPGASPILLSSRIPADYLEPALSGEATNATAVDSECDLKSTVVAFTLASGVCSLLLARLSFES